jgi:hypothetical protein
MPNKPYDFPEFEPLDAVDMERIYNGFCSVIKSIAEKIP